MVILVLLIINLWVFTLFWLDKRAAEKGSRRLSERFLLTLSVLGGSIGALLASQLFRHKTKKQPFRTLLIAALPINICCALLFSYLVVSG